MRTNRSTSIIALGLAIFVVGGALLYLVLRDHNRTKSATTVASSSTVSTTTTLAPGAVRLSATTPTTAIAFDIPTGTEALAVQMDYFAGAAGFVQPGDSVNVYAIRNKDCANTAAPLSVHLLESNVKVLEVLGSPPTATGTPLSYLLAVTPAEAEQIVFYKTGFSLYFTLTSKGAAPANPPAVTCANA